MLLGLTPHDIDTLASAQASLAEMATERSVKEMHEDLERLYRSQLIAMQLTQALDLSAAE